MQGVKSLILASSLLLAFPASVLAEQAAASTQARPEIAKYVQAYSGAQGLKVWTLRIGPRDAQEFIVQVVGVDHDWDGKIQKMKVNIVKNEQRFTLTTADGKSLVVLNLENNRGYLHLPGESQPRHVGYDEQLAAASNAEHFLTAYLQQAKR